MTVLILASGSATRARLLTSAGVPHVVKSPNIDEAHLKDALRAENVPTVDAAAALASAKAARIRDCDALVLGADQILECDGRWFDKPVSLADAKTHLLALAGKMHILATAAVVIRNGEEIWRGVSSPRIQMREFDSIFIDHYLKKMGDRVTETVGGYEMEGLGPQLFKSISGDPYAIQGLPLIELIGFLRSHGMAFRHG